MILILSIFISKIYLKKHFVSIQNFNSLLSAPPCLGRKNHGNFDDLNEINNIENPEIEEELSQKNKEPNKIKQRLLNQIQDGIVWANKKNNKEKPLNLNSETNFISKKRTKISHSCENSGVLK